MIYFLTKFLLEYVEPIMSSLVKSITTPVLTIIFTLVGISMLCAVVGIKFGTGMGAAAVKGIFQLITSFLSGCGKGLKIFLGWLSTILRKTMRRTYLGLVRRGCNQTLAGIIAAVVTLVLFVIIV